MTDLLVITNASAGSAHQEAVDAALGTLRERADVEVVATTSPEDCDAAVARRGRRRVVVCGGDGSVHFIVTALHRAGELADPIGLIPLGTGNDLARALGLPLDPPRRPRWCWTASRASSTCWWTTPAAWSINAVHLGVGAEAARAARRR